MIASAQRLQHVEEYYFSKKLKEVALLVGQGHDIINMGIGSPDLNPPTGAIKGLLEGLENQNAHKYQSYRAIPEFREAISGFYRRHYGVSVNPENQILPLMGSKEGIMHISMAFLNKDDVVLAPNPGYPAYHAVAKLVGARTKFYALTPENGNLPDLESLEKEIKDFSRVKLMWISYPHMPTGAKTDLPGLQKLVRFALKHQILLVNDNPYSFVLNNKPISVLQAKGAFKTALELNSLSKTFNMAGWRLGMLCGNEQLIETVLKVKSNMDSGMFYPLQTGAVRALQSSDEWFKALNETYFRRRALVYKIANRLNCTYSTNTAGMFVWAKLPDNETSSEDFIEKLLAQHQVFVAPGKIFGSLGEGYIRFSLCISESRIEEALNRITELY